MIIESVDRWVGGLVVGGWLVGGWWIGGFNKTPLCVRCMLRCADVGEDYGLSKE